MSRQTRMSPIGKAIWLIMQKHEPPYSGRALARSLSKDGTFPITPQSVSNYLRREHPPPKFVNAVVEKFNLSLEEERELHELYFHPSEADS